MPSCYSCNKEIAKKDDANVLAFLGLAPRTFCNNCYSSKERGFARHLLYFPKQPINSKIYKIGLWMTTFFVVLISIFISSSVFSNTPNITSILILIVLFLLVLLWQWVLYFMTKKILSTLK